MRLQAPPEEPSKGNKGPKSQEITKESLEIVSEKAKKGSFLGRMQAGKHFWNHKQINQVLLLDSLVVQGNRTLIF